ncbi:MAG TPA: hypothetical protein VH088_11085 [Terriglobales bacterium]|jgi:hypothetical protein|nr:hypothetical protein [Terriglobales bacterium]
MPVAIEFDDLTNVDQCVRKNRWPIGLVRRWRRLTRWEFWPPYFFYPPVVCYIGYLGVKFRGLALFTAANPSIPAGGFVGESKYEILENLKGASEHLPRATLIPSGHTSQRVAEAEEFIRLHQLQLPVVVKPDAGQRGSGVSIVRSLEGLRDYLTRFSYPAILQEYVPGEEFGVFYYRNPGEARGHIFSVTEKRMPVLVGDGESTLEELILSDDRALCMSEFYLHQLGERVHQVPAAGEPVQLVEIGTHCRGAIFLDASDTITPELEETIDQISKTFDGFYFGRFDVRVPSRADLMVGRSVKILELNGVTSEATHIYDPKISLLEAYRVLFRQWRIAFEIGKSNRDRGVPPSSVGELVRMVRSYNRTSLN